VTYSVLSGLPIPALPTIQRELHVSETDVAWLITGFLLSASVATSIIGRLGDMFGKERVLMYTLFLLAGGTLLGALSSSLIGLIITRVIQGAAGGMFPLAYGIIRDEFPEERRAGGIGLISAMLGVGGAMGLVVAGLIVQHLNYHWLFWPPLIAIVVAIIATWLWVPESPIRVPGRINWLAGVLMSLGISLSLLAISQTTVWGWGSPKTIGLLAIGLLICCAWVYVEVHSEVPLVDMKMMRIRGVWTANITAALLGAGLYSSLVLFPEFAQLPKSTGFGFGDSAFVAGLFLLPSALGMLIFGSLAGPITHRYGSKASLCAGAAVAASCFLLLSVAHSAPWQMLLAALLLGIGVALALSPLGNIVVQAVPPSQTGVATGMNSVMRTLGGAIGGQLTATFITDHTFHGLPTVAGFEEAFVVAAVFLVICLLSALLVPNDKALARAISPEPLAIIDTEAA
jgi:EmrB/QacA subfamily drug resistance transporter